MLFFSHTEHSIEQLSRTKRFIHEIHTESSLKFDLK